MSCLPMFFFLISRLGLSSAIHYSNSFPLFPIFFLLPLVGTLCVCWGRQWGVQYHFFESHKENIALVSCLWLIRILVLMILLGGGGLTSTVVCHAQWHYCFVWRFCPVHFQLKVGHCYFVMYFPSIVSHVNCGPLLVSVKIRRHQMTDGFKAYF